MLLLVFTAAALASAADVSALTTPVDKWMRSGDTVTVEGQSFSIHLSSRLNQVLADYGAGSLFIANNSCESTDIARICLDNVQYDFTDKVTKLHVRGISLAPSITITREASKSETIVGDEVLFSVAISNTGGLARNMTYEELPPAEFAVTEAAGLPLAPGRAVWKGQLAEGESASFSYRLKALKVFDGGLVASLSYSQGARLKTVYSSKQSLKVTPAVVLYAGIGSATALVGERNNITVNVTNRLPETAIMAPLEIVFDPGIKVTSKPYELKALTPWNYVWNGEIARVYNRTTNVTNLTGWLNTTKSWFFEFKGTRVGSSDIRVKASYRTAGNPELTVLPEKKQSVAVSSREVIVRTSLGEVTVEANQRKRLKVWLQNLNPYAGLKAVHANTSTALVYLPDFFGEIGAGEQVLLADKYFYAPKVNSSTSYPIVTNVSYFTEFGDNFSKGFRDTAIVVPTQEVTLTQALSRATAKAGDEIEVSVTVKNSRPTNLKNVAVFDNVSSEFTVAGKSQAIIEVPSKGTVTAYAYTLKVAHIGSGVGLHVNTTMRYSDSYNSDYYFDPQDYEITKVTPIAIEPESLPLTVTRAIDDSTTYAGEIVDARYTITNTATDKIAKNVVLKLPLAYELDLVGNEDTVRILHLGPGESVIVSDADRRRAKLAGSLELPKAVLEYENIYGDSFTVNGSATSLSVKDSYVEGPVILLEKLAPQSANNTDSVGVQLKLTNTGTEPAGVTVEDEGRRYSIRVQNKTEYVINASARYTNVGKFELPQAVASYSSSGLVLRTASKPATIEILDNPVLGIDKQAPANVTNIEPFSVLLKLKNKAPKPVINITVTDGGRSWHIDEIPEEGQANITYEDRAPAAGSHSLSPATAAYSYEGGYYTIQSNTAVLYAAEKSLVAVTKQVSPANATKGEKIKVSLRVKSLHDRELGVLLVDNEKSFSAQLPPNSEKDFGYDSQAGESTASPASATYTYNGQQLTALSPSPGFLLVTDKAGLPDEARKAAGQMAEKEKTGILSKLLRAVLNVLTWRRGG